MNVLLFIVMIVISFIAVRIGAIAFQLTGLEWSLAKFQSLSCFTGTGFTTKEAELITGNPQRRRIASFLMVLGNAGLVALIATFANSMRYNALVPKINIPFLHLVVPAKILPLVNLTIIVLSIFIIYKILTHTWFARKLTSFLRSRIIKKKLVKKITFEELLVSTGGYGVSQIVVTENSSILDKTIRDADLRSKDITVLSIEKAGKIVPNPPADTRINMGDRLICFGKLENIKASIYMMPR